MPITSLLPRISNSPRIDTTVLPMQKNLELVLREVEHFAFLTAELLLDHTECVNHIRSDEIFSFLDQVLPPVVWYD